MAQIAKNRFLQKLKSLLTVTCGGAATFCGINLYLNNEKFHHQFLMPMVHLFDPEKSHRFAINALKRGFTFKARYKDPPSLKIELWNMTFSNPVGLAAGFDKHAEALHALRKIGFGFVEVGSVTPLVQEGNPTPRVFRLKEDQAVINRYGFNSEGHDVVLERMSFYKKCQCDNLIVGVNLGKNKLAENPITDYVSGVQMFGAVADYLVINLSSPNTPGLRALQVGKDLETIIDEVLKARDELPCNKRPPVFIKFAPDLSLQEKKDIANLLNRKNRKKVDGIIISNTTIQRPSNLSSPFRSEDGGLSGKPLRELSTTVIRDMYKLTQGKIPIIGVGGIFSGEDAYEKICAGASLVQIYSSLVYHGFPVVTKIKRELQEILEKNGFESVSEVVGIDHR